MNNANPNNCAACDYHEMQRVIEEANPAEQHLHCYMFKDEPNDVCMQHTARYFRLLECPRGCGLKAPCPDCGPTLHG